jgi:hypothetical protein
MAALGAISVALLAAPAAGPAALIHVSSANCRPLDSKTLASDRRGRIYSRPLRGPNAEQDPEGARVVGCLFSPSHLMTLGTTRYVSTQYPAKETINPEVAAIAAPFAAYSTSFQGVDFNRVWAVVRNLRTDQVINVVPASPHVGVEPVSSITDLTVTASATVAWISQGRSLAGRRRNAEVAFSVPGQPTTILDEGDGIDPHSLELEGSTLTWIDEGTRRSASMP